MCSLKSIAIFAVVTFFACIGASILANPESFWEGFYETADPEKLENFPIRLAELRETLGFFHDLLWPWGHLIAMIFVLYILWGARYESAASKRHRAMSENNESPLGD